MILQLLGFVFVPVYIAGGVSILVFALDKWASQCVQTLVDADTVDSPQQQDTSGFISAQSLLERSGIQQAQVVLMSAICVKVNRYVAHAGVWYALCNVWCIHVYCNIGTDPLSSRPLERASSCWEPDMVDFAINGSDKTDKLTVKLALFKIAQKIF